MGADKHELVRGLNFTSTTALVIGSIIGTGVFFKAAVMAQQVGTPLLVLAAWVAAGVLSLAGALTYAELGAMLSHAGGEYLYVRAAYGDALGFLNGWMRFVVSSAGISALGVGFATFLSAILPMGAVWAHHTFHLLGRDILWQLGVKEAVAVAVILFFGVINCLGIAFGGWVQTLLTVLKIGGIVIVVVGAFFFAGNGTAAHLWTAAAPQWSGFQAFGAAMLSALWACDGWAFMPMVAGEVRNPGRNVPRALIIGVLAVLALYGLANLSYFYVLPMNEIVTANSTRYRDALPVAAKAAQTFLGARGPAVLSILFAISAIGALNGVILSLARIPFAMARDGLFFARMGELSARTRVPAFAILFLAVWSSLLALSGTFDQLTDMTIFSEWVFYGLAASAVFVLRRKMPDAPRSYRTFGYPVVPLLFVLVAAWLVMNTLTTSPLESTAGLALISLGLPVYLYCRRSRVRQGRAKPVSTGR